MTFSSYFSTMTSLFLMKQNCTFQQRHCRGDFHRSEVFVFILLVPFTQLHRWKSVMSNDGGGGGD